MKTDVIAAGVAVGTGKNLDVCIGWLDEFSMFRGPALKTLHLKLAVACPICLQNVMLAYTNWHENQERLHTAWLNSYNAVRRDAWQHYYDEHNCCPPQWMELPEAAKFKSENPEPPCTPQHAQIFGWSEIDC